MLNSSHATNISDIDWQRTQFTASSIHGSALPKFIASFRFRPHRKTCRPPPRLASPSQWRRSQTRSYLIWGSEASFWIRGKSQGSFTTLQNPKRELENISEATQVCRAFNVLSNNFLHTCPCNFTLQDTIERIQIWYRRADWIGSIWLHCIASP